MKEQDYKLLEEDSLTFYPVKQEVPSNYLPNVIMLRNAVRNYKKLVNLPVKTSVEQFIFTPGNEQHLKRFGIKEEYGVYSNKTFDRILNLEKIDFDFVRQVCNSQEFQNLQIDIFAANIYPTVIKSIKKVFQKYIDDLVKCKKLKKKIRPLGLYNEDKKYLECLGIDTNSISSNQLRSFLNGKTKNYKMLANLLQNPNFQFWLSYYDISLCPHNLKVKVSDIEYLEFDRDNSQLYNLCFNDDELANFLK